MHSVHTHMCAHMKHAHVKKQPHAHTHTCTHTHTHTCTHTHSHTPHSTHTCALFLDPTQPGGLTTIGGKGAMAESAHICSNEHPHTNCRSYACFSGPTAPRADDTPVVPYGHHLLPCVCKEAYTHPYTHTDTLTAAHLFCAGSTAPRGEHTHPVPPEHHLHQQQQ